MSSAVLLNRVLFFFVWVLLVDESDEQDAAAAPKLSKEEQASFLIFGDWIFELGAILLIQILQRCWCGYWYVGTRNCRRYSSSDGSMASTTRARH